VRGELSDDRNEGLALFCFDLDFDGGPLHAAAAPDSAPMNRFASPLGLSNPDGFGGTRVAGNLLQVGGGQNTINNVFAPQPNGPVVTGIALPGAEQELVVGIVDLPSQPGVYHLRLSNLIANAIREGETGVPFWRVDALEPGQIDDLIIQVVPMASTAASTVVSPAGDVSVGRGGEQRTEHRGGTEHAGERVPVLRSSARVDPSVPLGTRHGIQLTGIQPTWRTDRLVPSPAAPDRQGRAARLRRAQREGPCAVQQALLAPSRSPETHP
jgi:hypothetical protein